MSAEISIYSGEALRPHLEELAQLRLKVFHEWPYLYEGTLEEEWKYLDVYLRSERSLVGLARVDGEAVGATTAIPMTDESQEFQRPFREKGFNLDEVFYFGESIVLPGHRGHGFGNRFFDLREAHAQKTLPHLRVTTFCAVDRPEDHPRRPTTYRPLDEFWMRRGYQRRDDLVTEYPWCDVGETKETQKRMVFWVKEW